MPVGYDPALAERIRRALTDRAGVTEKPMFGGLSFLLDGKMFCGIVKDDLMVRVGPERYEAALGEAHVRPMDFTGRPMRGFITIRPDGLKGGRLNRWVQEAVARAESLPST